MNYARGKNFVRVGKIILNWRARQSEDAAILDGCCVTLNHEKNGVTWSESFGGLILSRKGASYGVAIGYKGARMVFPQRWAPRRIRSYIRWVRAGRPTPPLCSGAFAEPPSPGIREAARLAAVSELRRIEMETR